MNSVPTLGAIAVAFAAASARDVAAQVNSTCSGSPTANCTDVPVDGISYTSGVTTVNVGDGAAGETVVSPGRIGIELTRIGAAGHDEGVNVEFQVIKYDISTDPKDERDVVSADGVTPVLSDGKLIFATGGPPFTTFTIGTVDYTGEALMEFLATTSDDPGGSISGGLTVNNNAGGPPSGAGAPFATTNAHGIRVNSTGGRGGNGRCHTILVYTWCNNGDNGGSAGSVVVNSNSAITVNGTAEGKYGVTAVSQGGAGGNGGGSFGLFASKAGKGGNGGKSGTVFVTLGTASNITTHGAQSHGVYAESRGGNGGSGGAPSGTVALGSKGGSGGNAGNVNVINGGSILTTGGDAHGIYALSVGAGAGKGSGAGGLVAIGGNGGGQSDGARVTVNNSGSVETQNANAFGIFAQSIGGGGGDGGNAGGLFSVGGNAGSGGNSNKVTVLDSGTVRTGGDGSTAIVAQSIGGGGGNGGNAYAVSPTISVAIGGDGGLGGIGHEVSVTADGSDIDTAGNAAHGVLAQSIGGGGGNGGTAVSGALPAGSAVNVSVALGGNAGGGGDAGDSVTVTTSSSTDIDTKGTNAYGIAAQSIGGGGGDGGSAYSATGGASLNVAVAIGGKGGVAGAGKRVIIDNAATITTSAALSTGILAQSIGGGGGNGGFAGTLAIGAGAASVGLGGGAGGGGASGLVDVTNSSRIETGGENAVGIFAQSVGGGGGNGGSALSGSAGVIGIATAIGGKGGAGSNGGEVSVDNSGDLITAGALSYGIFGQSVGGGGGNGGFAISGALGISVEDVPGGAAAISIGGKGGGASSGGRVSIENAGSIQSDGLGAHAIFAQSVGGGGGNGGFAGSVGMTIGGGAAFGVSVGGGASGGGNAGVVDVKNTNKAASLITAADGADGIHAQSVGGGGGDGGFAMSGAFGFGGEASVNVAVAIGGAGGAGGEGNTVDVSNYAAISTHGKNANGIFSQSIGGGGGNGGLAVSGTLGLSETSGNVGVTVGGGGGTGNIARDVKMNNFGAISTSGIESVGILGQSIGGSGGNGGLALTAQLTGATKKSATVGVSVGGGGGTGNSAGIVEITNDFGGTINTTGFGAHGIEAQSIGGGGGNGGMAIVGQLGVAFGSEEQASKTLNVGVTVGGKGGGSGFGNTVRVTNNDSIEVTGDTATGIFAQSIGGGGGNGGGALNAIGMLTDSTNKDSRSVVATVTVGGGGGTGNDGGAVTVDNGGRITTHGVSGYGVFAQSVGGGGGIGGRANTFSLVVTDACTLPLLCKAPASNKNNFQLGVTVGGSGGGASNGGAVTVNNTGGIETFGNMSDGIYAQSIGGGGGAGGNGILGSGELLPASALLPFSLVGSVSFYKNLQATVGGNAGSSGDGGFVDVKNDKNITTHGSNSDGIFAQSVGGGGGVGGKAAIGATGVFGLGGAGGAAGNGGTITVNQYGDATIETYGSSSYGIFAQSVGGGGGVAGNIDRALATSNIKTPIPGVTVHNLGIGLAFGRSGGGGGDGGGVDVNVDGRIITHGDNAAGVFAQSVGGGGGVLGELGNDLPVLSLLSWQIGSAGDAGNAGRVDVDLTGSIATAGNNATGIFAQSAGGKGTAGAINVTLNSSILTGEVLQAGDENRGLGSIGILAQSAAANNVNNGDITIAINSPDAIVRGGRSQVVDADRQYVGVGVWVMDGKDNTIKNMGQITTLGGVKDGFAILATGSDATHPGGSETVNNFGTVTGSVNLGSGKNAFNNEAGAAFNTGPIVYIGGGTSSGTLTNAGTLSPGGDGNVLTTTLTGDLVQTGAGAYAVDLNPTTGASDRIDVSGTANLGGKVAVNLVNPGFAKPGNQASIILTGAGGATDAGLSLANEPLPVVGYTLSFADRTDVALATSIDFAPAGLSANNSAIGRHINDIQSAGGTPGFAPIAARLLSMPNIASLADAYDRLSPEPLLIPSITTVNSDLRFSDALHSCRVREGAFRFASEGECSWVRLVGGNLDQDRTDSNLGFTSETYTIAAGLQKKLDANWHAGFGFSVDRNRLHSSDIANSDGNQFAFGVIAKRNEGPAAFSASANVGYGTYDNTRYVNLPASGTTATSDQDVAVVSAHVRASYDFERKNVWYLRPLIDVGVTYVHRGAFNEQGAGAANLNVGSSNDTSVSVQPRIEFGREFAAADGTLIRPYGTVGVTQFLSGTTPSISATLQGAPAGVAPFTVDSKMDKTYGDVSVGVDVLSKDGTTLRIGYSGSFSSHSSFHSGGLKLSIPF